MNYLGRNLVSLYFSCGSPCNYTAFYDSEIGLSKLFEFAIATNIKSKVVLVAESDQLVAYNIFGRERRPLYTIKRDWSPAAALPNVIINAEFVKNDLYIKYLRGE